MNFTNVIYFSNIIIWLFPPLRQYKGGFFLYFLLLSVSDPLFFFIARHIGIDPQDFNLFASLLTVLIISYYKNKGIRYLYSIILFIMVLALYFFFNTPPVVITGIILLRITVLFYFFYFLLKNIEKNGKINFYFVVLTFYEITLILKFIAILFDLKMGMVYFYITTAFEIFVALYFILFSIKNSPAINFNNA